MTPNKLALPLVITLVLAGSAFRAEATLSLAATFDEKVENAQAIVLGKAVKTESRFDEEKRFILTYTTFEIEKTIKGGTPSQVTVVTPGGRVGDIQQTTVGVPAFEAGQESLLFLKDTRRGPTVLYFDQGAYDVVTLRGERVVRPVATDAVLIDEQRGVAAPPEPVRTLKEFESAVRTAQRRARYNRMEFARQQQRMAEYSGSIGTTANDFKWLIVAAALGVALAALHFFRR